MNELFHVDIKLYFPEGVTIPFGGVAIARGRFSHQAGTKRMIRKDDGFGKGLN